MTREPDPAAQRPEDPWLEFPLESIGPACGFTRCRLPEGKVYDEPVIQLDLLSADLGETRDFRAERPEVYSALREKCQR